MSEYDFKEFGNLVIKGLLEGMDATDREKMVKDKEALEKECYNGKDRSNSQMYKMAGNSIVVNVIEGILENLIIMEV